MFVCQKVPALSTIVQREYNLVICNILKFDKEGKQIMSEKVPKWVFIVILEKILWNIKVFFTSFLMTIKWNIVQRQDVFVQTN